MMFSDNIGRPWLMMTGLTSHRPCFLKPLFRLPTQGRIITMLELIQLVTTWLHNTQNDTGCLDLFMISEFPGVKEQVTTTTLCKKENQDIINNLENVIQQEQERQEKLKETIRLFAEEKESDKDEEKRNKIMLDLKEELLALNELEAKYKKMDRDEKEMAIYEQQIDEVTRTISYHKDKIKKIRTHCISENICTAEQFDLAFGVDEDILE